MAFDLHQIKQLDKKIQFVVHGYVRDAQSKFFSNNGGNTYLNIPDLIIYTIIAFYAYVDFFKYMADDSFLVEKNGTMITRINGKNYRTVYGSTVIPFDSNEVHRWKLKVIKGVYIAIGIDEASYEWTHDVFFGKNSTNNYGYAAVTGQKFNRRDFKAYGETYSSGDYVTMELNMSSKKLSFAKNDDKLKTAYFVDKTDIGYCLAVFIRYECDCVQIVSYEWH